MSTIEDTTSVLKASINSLPIEIKTQIVKLANLQDENYNCRAMLVDPAVDEGALQNNKWRGKSLNALFLVNKEWSNLAAVHLFRVLRRQELDSLTFELSILFHRNHFIKSVEFSFRNPEKLLRALSSLPNVYELKLSASVSRKLFGNLRTLGNSGQTKFDEQFFAFRTFGARITKLSLHGFDSIGATQFLSFFPNLKSLKAGTYHENPAEVLGLGNVLATFSSLQSLFLSNLTKDIVLSWKDLNWNSSSSLINLTLNSHNTVDINNLEIYLDFISIFSTSLKSLTLNMLVSKNISLIKPFFNLQYLNVETECASVPFIINSFPKSPIISLLVESLSADDFATNATHLETAFILFVNQHQTLRYLAFKDRFNRCDHFPNLIQLCAEKQIHLVFTTWIDQCELDINFTGTDNVDYRKPVLKEAFQFGQMRLLELERENDIEGMTEMFDKCEWLRASAAERKD